MGHTYAELRLSNAAKPHLDVLVERALVDTGAAQLCISRRVVQQLDLEEVYRREVTFADGRRETVPYVGPIRCEFGNRGCMLGAFVIGEDTPTLMGALPMQDMDLVVSPLDGKVEPDPRAPNIPSAIVA